MNAGIPPGFSLPAFMTFWGFETCYVKKGIARTGLRGTVAG